MVLRRRRGGGNLGILLLGAQLMNFGFEHIPPATLGLIAGQAVIYLEFLPQFFRSANTVCISSYLVYHHRAWRRLILSQFYHGDDMHLYFNMMSLLYKGSFLERKFGTPYFVYLTTVFTALTGATYVGLGMVLSDFLDDESYLTSCAVGFSGVLFAMKVLTTYYLPQGTSYVMGMVPVPSKYFFWAELVLIQVVAPNASLVGHLAGILVGLAYVQGPLKFLMDIFMKPEETARQRRRRRQSSSSEEEDQGFFSSIFSRWSRARGSQPRFHQGSSHRPDSYPNMHPRSPFNQGFTHATPSAPPSPPDMDPGPTGFDAYNNNYGGGGYGAPMPNPAYDRFTGGVDEDEQLRRAMDASLRDQRPYNGQPGLYPDLDEIRSRRSHYYQ